MPSLRIHIILSQSTSLQPRGSIPSPVNCCHRSSLGANKSAREATSRNGFHGSFRSRDRREAAAARGVRAVPGAGPHHPDAERGQAAPRQGLRGHLRQQRVQPRAPPPLPWRRSRGRRPGLPLRHHPRRPAAVRRRRRHPGHPLALQVHHGDLPGALPATPRRPQRRRHGTPARHLRHLRRRHGLLHGRRQGARPHLRPALDRQRHQLPRVPPLPPPHQPRPHPAQRCRAADERVPGHGGGRRAGAEEHEATGLPDIHTHHGPGRVPGALRAEGDGARGRRSRRDPQQLRRPGRRGRGSHGGAGPAESLHARPTPAFSPRGPDTAAHPELRDQPQPVERAGGVPAVAGQQGARLRGVRQLRQHHGHDRRADGGVRVGAGAERQAVPVDRAPGPRKGRRGRAAARVLGRDGGARAHGVLVPAAAGARSPCRGRLFDALRVELDAREHVRRRAGHQLAILRRPADQLQVPVQRVGRRHGDQQQRAEGRRRGAYYGDHGWGEGGGDEEEGWGVEGEGSQGGLARRLVSPQLRRICP